MSDSLSDEEKLLDLQGKRRAGEHVRIELPGAELSGLHLPGADLVGANLRGADLSGATLAGAHLSKADLRDVILVGASLDGADLTDADLRGADLAGAQVDDVVMANARLEGACLAALMGDPLSVTAAQIDRATVERSEFTMRDIAQMVIRGADVNEKDVVPRSIAPQESRSVASRAAVQWEADAEGNQSDSPSGASEHSAPEPSAPELSAPVHSVPEPSGPVPSPLEPFAPEPSAPEQPGPALSEPSMESGEEIPPPSLSWFDEKPPPSQRLLNMPPSSRTPSHHPSILPLMRSAEVALRVEIAESAAADSRPVSMRSFEQLSALIEEARTEHAPPVSLRPQASRVAQMAQTEFEFPQVGEEYLGVEILEALPAGTTSRSFKARTVDGNEVIVRIFNPNCEGAALQFPAFQRGLRALNKLQGSQDDDVRVIELISVSVDQTSYVAQFHEGKSLKELIDVSLSLEAGIEAILSVARTMVALHARGVMVRAWRPSNVMVDGFKLVICEPDMVHLPTLAHYHGNVGGYGAYAAPEEIIGQGTRSPTADVFSLGKMLEFLLTGQEPLVPLGSPPLISQKENTPEVLIEIVKRATAQSPMDRYQEVGEFLEDLKSFKEEGDRAVLLASIRPPKISRLEAVVPLASGPELPDLDKLIEKQTQREERLKEKRAKEPKSLDTGRQIEIALGLLGGIGGLLVILLLIFAPKSVDSMASMTVYLAGVTALAVLLVPRPAQKVALFRLATWAGLAGAIWLLNPLSLATFSWGRQVKSGSDIQKEEAVRDLVRVGKRNLSKAVLDKTSYVDAEMGSVNFTGASLRGVSFERSLLVEADFSIADLSEANFQGANLFGAKLETAINLEEARCDRYTKLPLDFSCKKGLISRSPQKGAPSPIVKPVRRRR